MEDWHGAAHIYSNLSEVELTLGEVAGAVRDAEQSVTYADLSSDAFTRLTKRTTHADALHQAGRRAEAETHFRKAEQMQAEREPAYPLLYSLGNFLYCDLLLTEAERAAWQVVLECSDLSPLLADDLSPLKAKQRAKVHEPLVCGSAGSTSQPGKESGDKSLHSKSYRSVSERTAQVVKWYELSEEQWLVNIALDHLTLSRAALYSDSGTVPFRFACFTIPMGVRRDQSPPRRSAAVSPTRPPQPRLAAESHWRAHRPR